LVGKDGDYVEKDQAIAEVDSDKATLEITCGSEWDYQAWKRVMQGRSSSLFN
jgi:hypothetical protein